jgi:hypothetical protein
MIGTVVHAWVVWAPEIGRVYRGDPGISLESAGLTLLNEKNGELDLKPGI